MELPAHLKEIRQQLLSDEMVIAGTVTMTLVYVHFFSVAEGNIKDVLYKKGILEKKEF